MLVLTRKLQQQIKIGDNITITVLKVTGSTIRIGIDAPRDVRVLRSELPVDEGTSDEVADAKHGPSSELMVRTAATAEKPSSQARSAHARNNPRFNMPPLKTSTSMPALAK